MGSLIGSDSVSSPSSTIELLRSVGKCRGDEERLEMFESVRGLGATGIAFKSSGEQKKKKISKLIARLVQVMIGTEEVGRTGEKLGRGMERFEIENQSDAIELEVVLGGSGYP